MAVQRDEMDAGADVGVAQPVDQFAASQLRYSGFQVDRIELKRVFSVGRPPRQHQPCNARQRRVIPIRNCNAACIESVELRQLVNAQGSLNVRHIGLEACFHDFVIPGAALRISVPRIATHPVQRKQPAARRELLVIGHDHSAFARAEILGRVEAEHRSRADVSDPMPLVFRAGSVRGVFHNMNAMTSGQFAD